MKKKFKWFTLISVVCISLVAIELCIFAVSSVTTESSPTIIDSVASITDEIQISSSDQKPVPDDKTQKILDFFESNNIAVQQHRHSTNTLVIRIEPVRADVIRPVVIDLFKQKMIVRAQSLNTVNYDPETDSLIISGSLRLYLSN